MLLGGIEPEKPMTQSQVHEHPLRNGASSVTSFQFSPLDGAENGKNYSMGFCFHGVVEIPKCISPFRKQVSNYFKIFVIYYMINLINPCLKQVFNFVH